MRRGTARFRGAERALDDKGGVLSGRRPIRSASSGQQDHDPGGHADDQSDNQRHQHHLGPGQPGPPGGSTGPAAVSVGRSVAGRSVPPAASPVSTIAGRLIRAPPAPGHRPQCLGQHLLGVTAPIASGIGVPGPVGCPHDRAAGNARDVAGQPPIKGSPSSTGRYAATKSPPALHISRSTRAEGGIHDSSAIARPSLAIARLAVDFTVPFDIPVASAISASESPP